MRTPIHLLTGFLGAGKTTLLSHLLHERTREKTAVLINEVGAVGLDHLLVEQVDQDVSVLPSGCICCTIRGELTEALQKVLKLNPDRVVLETTGLADPAPIVHALATERPLMETLALSGVITVLDALRARDLMVQQPEVRAQLELADRIVLTRLDLVGPEVSEPLAAALAREFTGAQVLRSGERGVPADVLLAPHPLPELLADASRWLERSTADAHQAVTSIVELGESVDEVALAAWLRMAAMVEGPRLLRVKGLVKGRTANAWLVFQSAQHAVSPVRPLGGEPAGWGSSKLVLITRGLPPPLLEQLVKSARQAATGQRMGA